MMQKYCAEYALDFTWAYEYGWGLTHYSDEQKKIVVLETDLFNKKLQLNPCKPVKCLSRKDNKRSFSQEVTNVVWLLKDDGCWTGFHQEDGKGDQKVEETIQEVMYIRSVNKRI